MDETQNFFESAPAADPDATLITEADASLTTPRFDEEEAQVARPVVPLAESSLSHRRRRWPIVLVLVSALVGGAVSIFAFRLYQQRQQPAAAATQVVEQEQEPTPPQASAPEPAPALTAAAGAEAQPQPETPAIIETFEPEKERAPKKEESPARKVAEENSKPAREAERKEERKTDEKRAERKANEKRAGRSSGDMRPRRVEVITEPRRVDEDMRRYDMADEVDEVELRREERRRQRREQRRGQRRNIDRIKDIFEGPPPA